MAEIGAVAWQFKEQGVIVIDGILEIVEDKGRQLEKITPFNPEELELQLMELAIEDLSIEDGVAEVTTSKSDFYHREKSDFRTLISYCRSRYSLHCR